MSIALLARIKKERSKKKEKENQNERVGEKTQRNAIPHSRVQRVNDVYIKNNSNEIFYPGDNI